MTCYFTSNIQLVENSCFFIFVINPKFNRTLKSSILHNVSFSCNCILNWKLNLFSRHSSTVAGLKIQRITQIGPFESSRSEKARVKVKVALDLHGIVTVNSAKVVLSSFPQITSIAPPPSYFLFCIQLLEEHTIDSVGRGSTPSEMDHTDVDGDVPMMHSSVRCFRHSYLHVLFLPDHCDTCSLYDYYFTFLG